MKLMALSVEGSRARLLVRVAFIVGLLGLLPSAADTRLYLDIQGVPGDVTDQGYKNQIAVLSYSLSPTGGGGGSMSVVKHVDSSSPLLTMLAATGEAIRRAVLRVVEYSDGKKDPKVTIDLRDVVVSSYQVSGNSTGGVTESVSINFTKMNVKYEHQK